MERGHLKRSRMLPEPSSIAGQQSSGSHRLPPEIVLFEILPWLPLQTILRFMRVCKDWHHIISGGNRRLAIKQFQRQLHRQPSPATSIGVIYGCAGYFPNLEYNSYFGDTLALLPFPSRFYVKHMAASSNGLWYLVCVHGLSDRSRPFAYICNPFMGKPGEWVPLIHGEGFDTFSPYLQLGPIGKTTRSIGLAFDPSASIRDDDYAYKLVQFDCICSESSRYELRFFVYSSNSGRWVRSGSKAFMAVDPSMSLSPFHKYSCPVFYAGGGKLYWHNPSFLAHYDAERDVADCMVMPELPAEARDLQRQELMVLRGGRLHCMRLLSSGCLEVWALLDDKQWERRKEVSLYAIMEKGLRVKGLIGLKNKFEFKLLTKGERIYEDEGRMHLRFFFNCDLYILGDLNCYLGAIDYDLEKHRVVRRCMILSKSPTCPTADSWFMMESVPIFIVHHTMLDVPTPQSFKL